MLIKHILTVISAQHKRYGLTKSQFTIPKTRFHHSMMSYSISYGRILSFGHIKCDPFIIRYIQQRSHLAARTHRELLALCPSHWVTHRPFLGRRRWTYTSTGCVRIMIVEQLMNNLLATFHIDQKFICLHITI